MSPTSTACASSSRLGKPRVGYEERVDQPAETTVATPHMDPLHRICESPKTHPDRLRRGHSGWWAGHPTSALEGV